MSDKGVEKEKNTSRNQLEFYVTAIGSNHATKYEKIEDAVKDYIASNEDFKQIEFSLRGLDMEVAYLASFSDNMNHIKKPEDVSRFFKNAIDAIDATDEEIENILKNLEKLKEPLMKDNAEIRERQEQILADYQMIHGKRIYQEINEEGAKTAHEMKYYYPYIEGTRTNEYKKEVDEAYSIADQIKQIRPEAAQQAYRLVNEYSKKLAGNINQSIEIDCMCPSDMIAGASNISAEKKQQQNAARNKNMEEYKEIKSIKDTLNNILSGKEKIQTKTISSIKKSAEILTDEKESKEIEKSGKLFEALEERQRENVSTDVTILYGEDQRNFSLVETAKVAISEDIFMDSTIFNEWYQRATQAEEKWFSDYTTSTAEFAKKIYSALQNNKEEFEFEHEIFKVSEAIETGDIVLNNEKNQVPEFDGKDNKRILSEREITTLDAPTDIDMAYDKLQDRYNADEISYEEFKRRSTILDINNQIGAYGLEKDEKLFSNLPIERQIEVSQEVQKGLRTLVNIDEINNGRISYDTIKAIASQGYIYQDGEFEKASHVETENKFFKKIENNEKMKMQLVFAGKPNEEIRDILKENYFTWSAKEKAWQRLLTGNARYAVDTVLSEFEDLDKQGKFKVEKNNSLKPSYKQNKKFHGKEFEERDYDYTSLEKQLILSRDKKYQEKIQSELEPMLDKSQNKLHQEQLGMVEDVSIEIEIGE